MDTERTIYFKGAVKKYKGGKYYPPPLQINYYQLADNSNSLYNLWYFIRVLDAPTLTQGGI